MNGIEGEKPEQFSVIVAAAWQEVNQKAIFSGIFNS